MFREFILGLLLIIAFCTPAAAAEKAKSKESAYERVTRTGAIRCGYFSWPPYIMKDPNTGALSGLNYDYMMEIGKKLGLDIEWSEEVSPGTAIAGLDAGRYDMMCASLWPDEARLKHAQLTLPTFYSAVYAVSRADDSRFDNGATKINDPAITIAGLDGDITWFLAKEEFPQAQIHALPQMADGAQLLQSVASGKADITLVDRGILNDFNRTNNNALKVVSGLPPVRIFPEVLAAQRNEVQLKLLIDNAIHIINDSGKPAAFIKKYPEYEFFAPVPGWSQAP